METIEIEEQEFEELSDIEEYSIIVTDYNSLEDKPSINGVELIGDKTSEDLGIFPYDDSEIKQELSNLDIEVDNLTENMNKISADVNTHTDNINQLEQDLSKLQSELLDDEETINHLADEKADKEEVYSKEDIDKKGYATTVDVIAAKNSCEPKLADTVDYCIQTGLYGNGESGYRKYKNGMLEQWGVATTKASETEFTMHQAHIDQNFSIFIEPREIGNFYHYAIPSANQKFKCRIQSRDSASMAIKFQWRSYGRWK